MSLVRWDHFCDVDAFCNRTTLPIRKPKPKATAHERLEVEAR